MSRCFRFPPPGYRGNRADSEALIDSIKLQKGIEKAKPETKGTKKREKAKTKTKDEKREKAKTETKERETKEKEKQKYEEIQRLEKAQKLVDLKTIYNQKERQVESDSRERSALTEEHGMPFCPNNRTNSSDSTQNSNKRKREESPNSCQRNGNVLRIRLTSEKQKVAEISAKREQLSSTRGKEQLCSTSGRTELPACDTSSNHTPAKFACISEPGFPVAKNDILAASKCITSHYKEIKRVRAMYRDLVQNWVPPIVQCYDESDDQDWLFGKENGKRETVKQQESGNTKTLPCWSFASQSRAQYLPEAEIYVLPFTVPF